MLPFLVMLKNCQFDEGPKGPKSSWDYMNEASKCYTGIICINHSKLVAIRIKISMYGTVVDRIPLDILLRTQRLQPFAVNKQCNIKTTQVSMGGRAV